jgi:hypothetical protein
LLPLDFCSNIGIQLDYYIPSIGLMQVYIMLLPSPLSLSIVLKVGVVSNSQSEAWWQDQLCDESSIKCIFSTVTIYFYPLHFIPSENIPPL